MRHELNIEVALRRMADRLAKGKTDRSVIETTVDSIRNIADTFERKMDFDQKAIVLSGKERDKGLTELIITEHKIGEGHRDRNIEVWSSGGE